MLVVHEHSIKLNYMLNNIDIKKLYDTGGKCKGLSALPSILKLGGACLILSVANFGFYCLYHRYKKKVELDEEVRANNAALQSRLKLNNVHINSLINKSKLQKWN